MCMLSNSDDQSMKLRHLSPTLEEEPAAILLLEGKKMILIHMGGSSVICNKPSVVNHGTGKKQLKISLGFIFKDTLDVTT